MAEAELQGMKVKSLRERTRMKKAKKGRVGDKLPKASNTQMNFEEVLKYINQCI